MNWSSLAEAEPTACQKQCSTQQKTLVACIDSIRAAKCGENEAATSGSGTSGGGEDTAADATPACLPVAVAAWTKCCEEANSREREHQEKAAAAS